MKTLSDTSAERSVLAGLITYGSLIYQEISTLDVTDNTFVLDSNRTIFKCVKKILESHDNVKPDIPLIYSAAAELGVKYWFQKEEEVQYLSAIIDLPIQQENVILLCKKIKKLEIIRNIIERLKNTENDLYQFSGTENINDIFGVIENSIINCASFLSVDELGTTLLSEGIEQHFAELENNPIDQVGVSTGFPVWDEAIGGGLRPSSVNVIAARPKVGKSTLCLNIAKHISELNIPVLILDTEMSKIDSWNRLISSISQIENKQIETGKYTLDKNKKTQIHEAISKVKSLPIYYTSIADQSLETQLSLIKRWIITTVGLTNEGKANNCVIIYDYLKIMTESEIKDVKEHQAIGFVVSGLINFAKKYNLPVLAFVQMNRDGINREDTGTVSLSDRILWFCSSLSIFKVKSQEEIDKDGIQNGNRKLKPLECRYGPGIDYLDYINCYFNKRISRITELKTRYELEKDRKEQEVLSQLHQTQ